MFYIWLIVSIGLAVLEMSTVNLVSIWYVISSLAAMILSLFISNVFIQVSVFVIGGTLLLILTKNAVKKILPQKTKTNIDRIIGMHGIVTEKITKKTPGEVKVDGKCWTVVSEENIPVDTTVKILEINSTKLKVAREDD